MLRLKSPNKKKDKGKTPAVETRGKSLTTSHEQVLCDVANHISVVEWRRTIPLPHHCPINCRTPGNNKDLLAENQCNKLKSNSSDPNVISAKEKGPMRAHKWQAGKELIFLQEVQRPTLTSNYMKSWGGKVTDIEISVSSHLCLFF